MLHVNNLSRSKTLIDKGRVADMKPWRIGRRRSAARFVIEMPSGVVKSTKTIVGDQLQITVT